MLKTSSRVFLLSAIRLVAVAGVLGLSLTAIGRAKSADDPPVDFQKCGEEPIKVQAEGMPFRTATSTPAQCDPIDPASLDPDPCAATWGVATTVSPTGASAPRWELLSQTTAPAHSACWYELDLQFRNVCSLTEGTPETGILMHNTLGYPLNVNLLANAGLGDFLPPSPTVGGSSVALLPPGAEAAPTGWGGLERPIFSGAVDLITGAPLAQVGELELPFGGATFRLIRTRSHSQRVERYKCGGTTHVIDDWWDWAGNGWMLSESPLLMIDSAVPDIVGDGPRTSYLILDAHHSIPFQRMEDTGQYEAPARFRAKMTHNGGGTWSAGTWSQPATRYYVSLYDGAITYSFLVVREDVPDNRWQPDSGLPHIGVCSGDYCISSMHARPFLPQQRPGTTVADPPLLSANPGQGVPYYGLCYQIADNYGHVVDITLGSQTQHNIDNPQSPGPESELNPSPTPCVECNQDCPSKGQIRSIRLRHNGEVMWTLLYRYRIAPRWLWDDETADARDCETDEPSIVHWKHQLVKRYDYFGTRALHSITVFRGDKPSVDTQPGSFYTISTEYRQYDGFEEPTVSALDYENPALALPTGLESAWVHQVKYGYAFQADEDTEHVGLQEGMLQKFPSLIKVATTSRREASGSPVTTSPSTKEWVFEYEPAGKLDYWLKGLYTPDAVNRAISQVRAVDSQFSAAGLALAVNDSRAFFNPPGSVSREELKAAATLRWYRGPTSSGLASPEDLREELPGGKPAYIRTETSVSTYASESSGQVGGLIVTDQDAKTKFYRIRRFVAGDDAHIAGYDPRPHRTAFHVPYPWRGWDDNPLHYTPPAYTQPRWITFIDEVDSRAKAEDDPPLNASSDYLTSAGQVGRRVVHVSASGVVLRDHQWRFKDGALTDSGGSGLGAEKVYWSAAEFLDAHGQGLPPAPDRPTTPDADGNCIVPPDHFASIRNEMLLMEHRSVGWSVADNEGEGDTRGFVRFFDYELRKYDSDLDPEHVGELIDVSYPDWLTDTTVRVDLRATGVKEGQAYTRTGTGPLEDNADPTHPRLYTQETFRPVDPAAPGGLPTTWTGLDDSERWEYEADVVYLVPTQEAGRLTAPLPAPGSAPLMTAGSTTRPAEPRVAITYRLTKRKPNGTDEYLAAFERPVEATLTIGPARRQRPNGEWYFPVERHEFDTSGKEIRTITGLVRNPLDPSTGSGASDPLQSLSHTVQLYDADGRQRHIIVDVGTESSASTLPALSVLNEHMEVPRPPEAQVTSDDIDPFGDNAHLPSGWGRIGTTPRNYVTTFVYAGDGRLSDIYYPTGRRWASRVIIIDRDEDVASDGNLDWNVDEVDDYDADMPPAWTGEEVSKRFAREYVFNDIELKGHGTDPAKPYSRMIGEIRDYPSIQVQGRPVTTRRVYFAKASQAPGVEISEDLEDFLTNPAPQRQPRFMEEQRVQYSVDSTGRLSRAELLEKGPGGAIVPVGSKRVYDLVDVVREWSFDGTITRTTRNLLGQSLRRYVGTDDSAWQPPSGTPPTESASGLALTDRYEYGDSIQDAWLPTKSRRYTYNPSWADDPYSTPPSSDVDGYVTQTFYDWRMRPVRVDQYGQTSDGNRDPAMAPRLSTTLTFLDQADRPILVATFGSGTLDLSSDSDIDPVARREWLEDDQRPDVKKLFELDVKPTSVVETFYGPDGDVVQKRTYQYDDSTELLSWLEENSFSGRMGNNVYRQSPQQAVTISTLDGLGRVTASKQLEWDGTSWGRELSRTEYLLDADGNVCGTSRFDRVAATGPELAADGSETINAVRTRSVAWFDPQKRQTASAELGSESMAASVDAMIATTPSYVRTVDDANGSEPWLDPEVTDSTGAPDVEERTVPSWAALSINRYSMLTGRLVWTRNPDGTFTEFGYDPAGRLASRTDNRFGAAGESRRTEYEYTLGRLTGIKAQRSAGSSTTGNWQTTRIVYGAKVFAEQPSATEGVPPTYAPAGVHHASWIGRMHLPVPSSGDPSFVPPSEIPLVHEDTDLDTGEVVLRYTFNGLIAERIDARGLVFRYFYDGLDRLEWVVMGSYESDEFRYKLPEGMSSSSIPVDRIQSVQYIYDINGRLSDVIARTNPEDPESILTHTRYEYDERGNLIREWQGHDGDLGETPPTSTPKVDYEWDYQASDTAASTPLVGHDRLASITYPVPPGGNDAARRKVLFNYGTSGGSDDRLSRLKTILSGYNGFNNTVASFGYAGVSRRASMTLNSGDSSITADLVASSGVGLSGLDMFGRLKDLHYKSLSNTTLYRGEHAYNVSGDRLYDRVTQAPADALHNGSVHVLDARSHLYGYDSLHRLTTATVGQISGTGLAASIASGTTLREDQWWLDLLGNWQPDPGIPPEALTTGRFSQGNLDGYDPTNAVAFVGGTKVSGSYVAWQDGTPTSANDELQISPASDGRNEITGVYSRLSTSTVYKAPVPIRYDQVGNLIFDGTYIYQYDAWSRLVQVNAGAVNEAITFNPANPFNGLVFGPMLKHYTYDGLGRLVRTQSPLPVPSIGGMTEVRSEWFYYDGIRRIQEVRIDPMLSLMSAMTSGHSGTQLLGEQALTKAQEAAGDSEAPIETSASTVELENNLLNMDPPGSEEPLGGAELVREYVWGPGDSWHATPTDELLVYYAEGRVAWWPLQDAGGDVVAVCAPGLSTDSYRARVVAQQRYDAYGQVIAADHIHPHAFLAVGHKGLFYDRLDRGVSDFTATGSIAPPNTGSFGTIETPRLVPFARGLYHVRNRAYIPGGGSRHVGEPGLTATGGTGTPWASFTLSQAGLSSGAAVQGRWMQADPNDSGIQLISSAGFHGVSPDANVQTFDLEGSFRDGANRYQYLGSSPWAGQDPLGLFDFSIVSLFFASTSTIDLQADWTQQVGDAGNTIRTSALDLLNQIVLDQADAVDWALDWSRSDDEFSGSRSQALAGNDGVTGYALAGIRHHIMTIRNRVHGEKFTKQFLDVFKLHGIGPKKAMRLMSSTANVVTLTKKAAKIHAQSAGGGYHHSIKYHQGVLRRITRALKKASRDGRDIVEAAQDELAKIADILQRNPKVLLEGF